MNKIELLAPAGNLERLKIALLYGADAVYFGGRNYSLRANAKNLSLEEIKEACDYAHKLKKKVYVTVNIVFHNEDIDGLKEYLKELAKCKVDAIIVSDPLVIDIVKKNKINLEIHLSTQYSTVNYEAVDFWKSLGVKRIVLGRETSKEEIQEIIDKTGMDLEIFIHGAMCSSYSGRCVLSNYFTNRDANRGGCAQICRWKFSLVKDEKEIENPTKFTMSCKDLCMLEYLPEIINLNVKSLKVEGRMRSVYYIATVINVYRRAIDDYYNGFLTDEKIKAFRKVLNKVANRDSCDQFFNTFPTEREQYFLEREEPSNQDYLAMVDDYDGKYVSVISKNYFKKGDRVEIISPDRDTIAFTMPEIYDKDNNQIDISNRPEEIVKFKLDVEVKKYDMLRISQETDENI